MRFLKYILFVLGSKNVNGHVQLLLSGLLRIAHRVCSANLSGPLKEGLAITQMTRMTQTSLCPQSK